MKIILLSSCLRRNIRASGADPGFFSGGGAPLRNDVTAGEVKRRRKLHLRAGEGGRLRTPCTFPLDPPLGMINNYWMRLSMISWIIKSEVCVISRSRRLRQITQTRDFDNSWYHAKKEFNNCFVVRFSHNSSSETEVKRLAILFLRRTLQGA